MIHSGLPFYNPFIGVAGGVALNWALQTQPSPPTSPSTSPVSAQRLSSFSIDAILGRRHHHTTETNGGGAVRNLERRREERLCRSAPYSTGTTHIPGGTNHSTSIRDSSNNVISSGGCQKTKTKRVRTIFTAEQLERLETEFAHQQYMVGPERLYLAAALQLTEAQVKVWFQNRRIKWRKAVQEQNQARFSAQTPPEDIDPKISTFTSSPLRHNEESNSSSDMSKSETEERLLADLPSALVRKTTHDYESANSATLVGKTSEDFGSAGVTLDHHGFANLLSNHKSYNSLEVENYNPLEKNLVNSVNSAVDKQIINKVTNKEI